MALRQTPVRTFAHGASATSSPDRTHTWQNFDGWVILYLREEALALGGSTVLLLVAVSAGFAWALPSVPEKGIGVIIGFPGLEFALFPGVLP